MLLRAKCPVHHWDSAPGAQQQRNSSPPDHENLLQASWHRFGATRGVHVAQDNVPESCRKGRATRRPVPLTASSESVEDRSTALPAVLESLLSGGSSPGPLKRRLNTIAT